MVEGSACKSKEGCRGAWREPPRRRTGTPPARARARAGKDKFAHPMFSVMFTRLVVRTSAAAPPWSPRAARQRAFAMESYPPVFDAETQAEHASLRGRQGAVTLLPTSCENNACPSWTAPPARLVSSSHPLFRPPRASRGAYHPTHASAPPRFETSPPVPIWGTAGSWDLPKPLGSPVCARPVDHLVIPPTRFEPSRPHLHPLPPPPPLPPAEDSLASEASRKFWGAD
jgi:hypothetical protein